MTKLSICIPVEAGKSAPIRLANELLGNPDADLEIIVAPCGDNCRDADDLYALAERDPRLMILPAAPADISPCHHWLGTVAAMRGEWVTVIRPDDAIEADIAAFIAHAEGVVPGMDAFSWNNFQIDAGTRRDIPASVAIPMQHHTRELDKDDLITRGFKWVDSSNVPNMAFGVYHAAISRKLLETVLANSGELSWQTPLPQYEWAARVLIYAQKFGFSSRPLSAVDAHRYIAGPLTPVMADFPFHAGIGLTAGIAEIHARVLRDLGIDWENFDENFVRACMIDCLLESREDQFEAMAQRYYAAIQRMDGGRLAGTFRPPYMAEPEADPRRGRRGMLVFANRFIGGAVTAVDFFAVVRHMLAPIEIVRITASSELLAEQEDKQLRRAHV